MSCYIRHLNEIMDRLSLENTKEGCKILDQKIRQILSMEDASCPNVWERIKPILLNEDKKEELIIQLKKIL